MKRCCGCFELINEDLEICPFCGYVEGSYQENNKYLVPGTMLSGRYTVGKVISSDEESITYAAWDNDSNVKVNVREYFPDGYVTRSSSSVIPINNDSKEHFEAGFSNYVEVAKQLFGGNGSVKLYDCIAENNTAYMILENSDLAASPNAYAQSASGNKSLAGKSKGLPLWAKIVIPTTTVVVIAGVVVGIAFACGVFKQSEDSFVVSRGSEDSQNTDDSDDIPHEDGWYKDGNDSYYYQDGKKIKGWLNITEHKYYFDPDTGIMAIGWQDIDGEKYYFEDSGEMVNGWQSIDGLWYCFDEDSGVMQTGWIEQKDGDQTDKYYFNPDDGSRVNGWNKINGDWYYFNSEDGKMVKDWKQIDDSWYYFDSDGIMKTGWLESGDDWYYLDDDGKMVTDIITVDGVDYIFNLDGEWLASRPSGAREMKSYIGKNANDIIDEFGGFRRAEPQADGWINDTFLMSPSSHGGDTIVYFRIINTEEYCLYGLVPGMDFGEAVALLEYDGAEHLKETNMGSSGDYKICWFEMSDGNVVEIVYSTEGPISYVAVCGKDYIDEHLHWFYD